MVVAQHLGLQELVQVCLHQILHYVAGKQEAKEPNKQRDQILILTHVILLDLSL
jgi:hypothetical protein